MSQTAVNPAKPKPQLKEKKRKEWGLLLLALPFLIYIFMFSYVPLAGWYLAFIKYKVGMPILKCEFVGFRNFQQMFATGSFGNALRNTLIYSGLGYLCKFFPPIFAILLNEIGNRQHVVNILVKLHAGGFRQVAAAERIVRDDIHPERVRPFGYEAPNATEAENGKRLLVELDARKAAPLPLSLPHRTVGNGNVACTRKEKRHGVLCSGDDIRGGRVADDNAVLRGGIDVDVVYAHACTSDDLQILFIF